MDLQKLIEKYENENKSILNRRPDLDMQGDFTPDGIKLFCNNGFIEDLRAYGNQANSENANRVIFDVSRQSGSVFILQHKETMIIHGCFATKNDAEKYANDSPNIAIIKLDIA